MAPCGNAVEKQDGSISPSRPGQPSPHPVPQQPEPGFLGLTRIVDFAHAPQCVRSVGPATPGQRGRNRRRLDANGAGHPPDGFAHFKTVAGGVGYRGSEHGGRRPGHGQLPAAITGFEKTPIAALAYAIDEAHRAEGCVLILAVSQALLPGPWLCCRRRGADRRHAAAAAEQPECAAARLGPRAAPAWAASRSGRRTPAGSVEPGPAVRSKGNRGFPCNIPKCPRPGRRFGSKCYTCGIN